MLPGVIIFLNGAFDVGKTSTARALQDALPQSLILDPESFRLTATKDSLRARILGRADEEGPHDWCLTHLPVAMAAFRDEESGSEITTDGSWPAEVASAILLAL